MQKSLWQINVRAYLHLCYLLITASMHFTAVQLLERDPARRRRPKSTGSNSSVDQGHEVFLTRSLPGLPSMASYANLARCERRRTSARSFDAGESGECSPVAIGAKCADSSAGSRGEGIGVGVVVARAASPAPLASRRGVTGASCRVPTNSGEAKGGRGARANRTRAVLAFSLAVSTTCTPTWSWTAPPASISMAPSAPRFFLRGSGDKNARFARHVEHMRCG